MVVTTGASHRQPQERLGKNVQLIVEAIGLILVGIDRTVGGLVQIPEAGGDHRLVEPGGRMTSGVLEQIPRDLLPNELVIRHVLVERADEVITVLPRIRNGAVLFVAVGFGEAD